MPPKFVPKERAWGTRYDTLDSSPPPSPSRQIQSTITTPTSPITSVIASSREPSGDGKRAFHASTVSGQPERMPHDASVFVGSLPMHIDHSELTRLLYEHLSQHTEVKNIKVVRDNKGGTCAFVQCEDASAAARLIRTLQSHPPRPFLGRILRYEPARAFRMLLVSYCRPTGTIPNAGLNDSSDALEHSDIISDPPTAVRIYRPQDSRSTAILYDHEARHFESKDVAGQVGDSSSSDALSGEGLLFDPMRYDAENMLKLASAFGTVEHFAVYGSSTVGSENEKAATEQLDQPHPHNAPRSENMNTSVWEVKWSHRDDCVAALTTLRRVSFLNVSWAHHAAIAQGVYHDRGNFHSAPFLNSRFSSFPPHIRTESHSSIAVLQNADVSAERADRQPTVSVHDEISSAPSPSSSVLSPQSWTFGHRTPSLRDPLSPFASSAPGLSGFDPVKIQFKSSKWSEKDFPPHDLDKEVDLSIFSPDQDNRPWGDRDLCEEILDDLPLGPVASGSPSSSLSVNPSTTPAEVNPESMDAPESGLARSLPLSPTRMHHALRSDDAMRADSTPAGPSISSVTPFTPKIQKFLPTSVTPNDRTVMESHHYAQSHLQGMGHISTPKHAQRAGDSERAVWPEAGRRELDPTTVFVGGLEMYGMNAWDEAKLHDLFGRYGNIENIQLVCPSNKRSAFAFVRFTDTEATARAVQYEHNRMHNGRQIRVQLRDNNPQRSPWRHSRGRGRVFSNGHMRPNDEVDPSRGQRVYSDIGERAGSDMTREASYTAQFHERQTTFQSDFQTFSCSSREKAETKPPQAVEINNSGTSTGMHAIGPEASDSTVSSLSSSATKVSFPQSDAARDQSTATVASFTPPPSTTSVGLSAPVGGTSQHYPMQTVGHYPPQPWIHTYPHYYPYPPPFIHSYPGFQQPAQQAPYAISSSDSGSSHVGAQNGWTATSHVYRPMVPFVAYPPVPPPSEQAGPHASQATVQPPLRATGFIQGEHGMLIPVYQPEALNQYMSNAEHPQSPPPHVPAPRPPVPVWPQYPHMPMYPYSAPVHSLAPSPSQQSQVVHQRGWVPSPAPLVLPATQQATLQHAPPPYMLTAGSSGSLSSAGSFRGSYPSSQTMHQFGQRNTPPPRRYNRRESVQNSGFNSHRIQNSRASPNRFTKNFGNGPSDVPYSFVDRAP